MKVFCYFPFMHRSLSSILFILIILWKIMRSLSVASKTLLIFIRPSWSLMFDIFTLQQEGKEEI